MTKKSRTWFFTLNNYIEKDEKFLQSLEVTYLCYGREVGKEKGTKHLQGYVTFIRGYTLKALKKLVGDRYHLQPAKAKDGMNYCKKDMDFYEVDNRKQGKRTDLEETCKLLKEQGLNAVKEKSPEVFIKYHSGLEKLHASYQKPRKFKPKVEWIYGKTGVGKTKFVCDKEDDLWISGKNLKWWLGYENQEAVLIDDFRKDFCTFHELLRILDRYPYAVEVKNSYRQLNSKRMYITCPYHPSEVYDTREDIEQLLRRIDKITNLEQKFENLASDDDEDVPPPLGDCCH